MKVLITGGAGFIGSATGKALIRAGHDVRVLDNLQPPVHPKSWDERGPEDAIFIPGDVRNPQVLLNAMKGVDAVLHLAAYQDFRQDWSTFFDVNAAGAARIYELIVRERLPIKRVVLASSQAVLGDGAYTCDGHKFPFRFFKAHRTPEQMAVGNWNIWCPKCGMSDGVKPAWTTESEVAPAIPYGVSKLAAEQVTKMLGQQYGIPTVNLRYSIVQGATQSPKNAYSGVLRAVALQLLAGDRDVIIFEDGLQQRDYIDVNDVVYANLLALDGTMPVGTYNIGGAFSKTVRELAEAMCELAGTSADIKTPGMYRVGDIRHTLSDVRRAVNNYWMPSNPITNTWRTYWEWLPTVISQEEARRTIDAAFSGMIDSGAARMVA